MNENSLEPSEDLPAATGLQVGSILYGFAGGCFGRDSYNDRQVEALGPDWAVARDTVTGEAMTYTGDLDFLAEYTNPKWQIG